MVLRPVYLEHGNPHTWKDCLILNMGIPIPGKTVLSWTWESPYLERHIIEMGPSMAWEQIIFYDMEFHMQVRSVKCLLNSLVSLYCVDLRQSWDIFYEGLFHKRISKIVYPSCDGPTVLQPCWHFIHITCGVLAICTNGPMSLQWLQIPCYWPFVRGIHQWLVDSPHKGPVTSKPFPFDDVIMWTPYTLLVVILHPRIQLIGRHYHIVSWHILNKMFREH